MYRYTFDPFVADFASSGLAADFVKQVGLWNNQVPLIAINITPIVLEPGKHRWKTDTVDGRSWIVNISGAQLKLISSDYFTGGEIMLFTPVRQLVQAMLAIGMGTTRIKVEF